MFTGIVTAKGRIRSITGNEVRCFDIEARASGAVGDHTAHLQVQLVRAEAGTVAASSSPSESKESKEQHDTEEHLLFLRQIHRALTSGKSDGAETPSGSGSNKRPSSSPGSMQAFASYLANLASDFSPRKETAEESLALPTRATCRGTRPLPSPPWVTTMSCGRSSST